MPDSPMKDPYVSIVIPTLDEEKNIGSVIAEIGKWMRGRRYEIIVVDGNSGDRTVSIA